MIEFRKYPKTNRLENAVCHVTEKLDGTNVAILKIAGSLLVGSRNGWLPIIHPSGKEHDNFGTLAFVNEHREYLLSILPDGWTYGELVGKKIGRGYGIEGRKLFLFNRHDTEIYHDSIDHVPYLGKCKYSELDGFINNLTKIMHRSGSRINSEFKDIEGFIVTIEGSAPIKIIVNK